MGSATVPSAYILGGSSGIGLAVAQELVRKGKRVLLIARNAERLEAALQILTKEGEAFGNPQPVSIHSLDVGNPEAIKNTLLPNIEKYGEPYLLVNCAGEAYPGYFEQISDEVFEQTLNVHLKGTWYMIRALLPYLKKHRGTIVNVSSVAGMVGVFGYTAYSAVKAAVIGFSEALRSELRFEGVRVVVLCPPDTDTPGFEKENRSKPPETKAIAASAGVLKAEKVARELLKGIMKGKFLIVPGLEAKFTSWMVRHFPFLVRWLMDRAVRNYRNKRQKIDLT